MLTGAAAASFYFPKAFEHARGRLAALEGADAGPVAMGNAGGGTGACALGFKAGIGSASRRVPLEGGPATVGVLVQACAR